MLHHGSEGGYQLNFIVTVLHLSHGQNTHQKHVGRNRNGPEAAPSQTSKRVSGSATVGHLSANMKPTCAQ